MAVLQQMTYDLMGVEKNAYGSHFGGLNEQAVIDFTIKNKLTVYTRTIYQKIRYVKYMCGDMDGAAVYYDLLQDLYANCAGQDRNGEFELYFSIIFGNLSPSLSSSSHNARYPCITPTQVDRCYF